MKIRWGCSEESCSYNEKLTIIFSEISEELLSWLEGDLNSKGLQLTCPVCSETMILRTQGRNPEAPLAYLNLFFEPYPASLRRHSNPTLRVGVVLGVDVPFTAVEGLKRIDG